MAFGDPYATLGELKAFLKIDPQRTDNDPAMTIALNAASREIENHCNREFNNDYTGSVQGAATTRVYKPTAVRLVIVDDFYTTTDLVIAHRTITSNTTVTWTPNTYYELEPVNGVVNGVSGWPYRRIVLPFWRYLWNISRIEVTAHWGWAAVPAPVTQACLLIAAQNYKMGSAPFGVAGTSEGSQGLPSVRVHQIPDACEMLHPYVGTHPLVG